MAAFDRFQPPTKGATLGQCTDCKRTVCTLEWDAETFGEHGLCGLCFEEAEAIEAARIDAELARDAEFAARCDALRAEAIEHQEAAASWLRAVEFVVEVTL